VGGGTFLALTEKIPHLQRLGVTAVELLPVAEFNEGEPTVVDPVTGTKLTNFWGYASLNFFAPEINYASRRDPGGAVFEFQEMVKRFHRAGIEVILDVVFNHSGEGDETGPTLVFRGLDNAVYYMLDEGRRYKNYSGCGNTLNCNQPVMKQLILDSLRYWLVEMHVDGFRFDLATILGRSRSGEWIGDLGLLHDIGGDPVLRGCKLIAEAWDADGMYKVGGFPRDWAEWNGRFRDDVRRFIRGDEGMVQDFARRMGGSQDIFGAKAEVGQSINFITAHDGFTLRDLVSYKHKHNMRNGEQNRDGCDENFSSNFGIEGETSDGEIRRSRLRRAKNLMVALFMARGTPMMLAGDELWRTQEGNNNTYCQDNALGWVRWTPSEESEEMQRFVRMLTWLRRRHPVLRGSAFVDPFSGSQGGMRWHGVTLGQPDWSHPSHALAWELCAAAEGVNDINFYVAFNAWREALVFKLPPGAWRRIIDTHLASPADIVEEASAELWGAGEVLVHADTAVVLVSEA